jgi:nitrilase
MKIVRVAVVQAAPVVFDLGKSLEKVRQLVPEAADRKARIVLFPEGFLPAYPKGLDFGARVGMRLPEGRDDFRRYWEGAVDVPGPVTESLGSAARESKVYLVMGVIERDAGTLYCTVLFFAPDGTLMGRHRKLMPTAMERLIWGFGDGSTLPVFETELGKLGAVICWENYMPLLRSYMYSKGIQIYCAPTADDRDTWIPTLQHIALEGRCFVLSCCQYLTRADCPEDYAAIQGNDPHTVLMRGGSCIVAPLGKILAGPDYAGECILTADLDMDDIPRGKYDFDATGHYARPDIFRLYVNERPMPAVVSISGTVEGPFDEKIRR